MTKKELLDNIRSLPLPDEAEVIVAIYNEADNEFSIVPIESITIDKRVSINVTY